MIIIQGQETPAIFDMTTVAYAPGQVYIKFYIILMERLKVLKYR